jgi:putative transposase
MDDACYHVLSRGNNRAPVFFEEIDRQRYGQWLLEFSRCHRVLIYHYCLMTNHVHLVVRAANGLQFRLAIQRLNLTYAKYLRRTYGHVGHVWQDRFKSFLIADDPHLLQCGAYIELNPLRARMVTAPAKYPWSSYRV